MTREKAHDGSTERAASDAASSSAASAAIDPKFIDSLRELGVRSGVDLVAEIVELFLRLAPGRVAELRSALERGDAGAAERSAHAFRGSAANLGAEALAEECANTERAARAEDMDLVRMGIAAIETELARVMAELPRVSPSGDARSDR